LLFQTGPEAAYHIWGWRELERLVPQATPVRPVSPVPGPAR